MVTSEQVVAMAKTIWPLAKDIEVSANKPGRKPGGGSEPDGFRLSITDDGGNLLAVISDKSLTGLQDKLEQRTRKNAARRAR